MKVENHGGLLEDKDMTVVQVMCYLDQTTFSISHPKTSKTGILTSHAVT